MDFCRDRGIIVRGKDWLPGVVGLAAGKLTQKYSCPSCVLTENDEGLLVGSLRSVPGVSIINCLNAAAGPFKENLIIDGVGYERISVKHGGHSQAAGVTLAPEMFDLFYERMQNEMRKAPEECFRPLQEYDL